MSVTTTDPKLSDGPDGAGAAVLDQRPWDDLQGAGDCTVGPLMNTSDGFSFLIQGLNKTQTLIRMHIWAVHSQIQFPEKCPFCSFTSSGSLNINFKI